MHLLVVNQLELPRVLSASQPLHHPRTRTLPHLQLLPPKMLASPPQKLHPLPHPNQRSFKRYLIQVLNPPPLQNLYLVNPLNQQSLLKPKNLNRLANPVLNSLLQISLLLNQQSLLKPVNLNRPANPVLRSLKSYHLHQLLQPSQPPLPSLLHLVRPLLPQLRV